MRSIKRNGAVAFLLFIGLVVSAQNDCPKGYEQIYELCNRVEVPKCIIAARQDSCNLCWEVHYAACEGKASGGMLSFDTYCDARDYAQRNTKVNACPWYNSQVYRIVLNNPKNCAQKPTGHEMASFQNTQTGSGDVDDLLNELLSEESVIANDTNAQKEWEQVKKETKETLAKEEPEKSNAGSSNPGTQNVGLRGLAGKIQSGEYDPYASKQSNGGVSNSANGNTTAGNGGGNVSQENYAIFWIRSGTFTYGSPQLNIKLNGQYIMVKPGSGKVIQGARSSPPPCGNNDSCDDLGWCGDFIRVKLTQIQNTWAAEEQHGGGNMAGVQQKWYGSFTTQPGCNIIEVR